MATTTLPNRQGLSRGKWLGGGIALIVLGIIAALVINSMRSSSTTSTVATSKVTRGTIVATVDGSGTIAAAQSLDLGFATTGTVKTVLVNEGDTVKAGQALAQLDDADLQLQVASAQAALDSATLKLGQAQSGNALPADLAAQQAAVASAQAQLRAAQAQLDALRHPTADALSAAETAVRQAQLDLQSQTNTSSANKTKAQQDLQRAVEALTQAQSKYATALQNWQYVQDTGNDPVTPTKTSAQGKAVANTLNDAQRQQYYDAYVQATASMHSAETAVQQAQVSYESARQAEPLAIAQAQAKLADAQAQLVALQQPSATNVAQKQASVDQARASLTQAQANLAKLTAPSTASDVSIQQNAITQAEQTLKQAQLKLADATLTAPFDGVITTVNIVPGSSASGTAVALSLIDRSTLHIDMKLSENDVAKVSLGQRVALTIDALKDWKAQGTVSYISPVGASSNGVVTYAVRVSFPDSDARVKVGMTANLSITTASKDGALLVPTSALLPKGAGHAVLVPNADGTKREVEVQTGLSDSTQTEITGGLSEGDSVVTTAATSTTTQTRRGPFG
ncbi:efflux RND transporter periplasmic adaptor subunit [Kouleothrix sp.]|uniref:efflux RND transporter periplasmic adaptor subunit n=1 Tax=Kouleothrix sp. TaxID=2779161 RepID=UPI00391D2A65